MFERKNYLDKARIVPNPGPKEKKICVAAAIQTWRKKSFFFSPLMKVKVSNPHLKSFSLLASDERESALKCFWGGILVFGQRH